MDFRRLGNKVWALILGVLGVVFLLWRREHGKRVEADQRVENAEWEKKDAVLTERQEETHRQITTEEKRTEAEKSQSLTPDELAERLKKL